MSGVGPTSRSVLQVIPGASSCHYYPPRSYLLQDTFISLWWAIYCKDKEHSYPYAVPCEMTFVHVLGGGFRSNGKEDSCSPLCSARRMYDPRSMSHAVVPSLLRKWIRYPLYIHVFCDADPFLLCVAACSRGSWFPCSRCISRIDVKDPICSQGSDTLLENPINVLIPSSSCTLPLDVFPPQDARTFREYFPPIRCLTLKSFLSQRYSRPLFDVPLVQGPDFLLETQVMIPPKMPFAPRT